MSLRRLGKPVSSSVLARIFSSPRFRECFSTSAIRMNARNRVAIVGRTINAGKYPGRRAMIAKRVGLIKTERAINAGWIAISVFCLGDFFQNEKEIRTMPSNQPSSVSCPNS